MIRCLFTTFGRIHFWKDPILVGQPQAKQDAEKMITMASVTLVKVTTTCGEDHLDCLGGLGDSHLHCIGDRTFGNWMTSNERIVKLKGLGQPWCLDIHFRVNCQTLKSITHWRRAKFSGHLMRRVFSIFGQSCTTSSIGLIILQPVVAWVVVLVVGT